MLAAYPRCAPPGRHAILKDVAELQNVHQWKRFIVRFYTASITSLTSERQVPAVSISSLLRDIKTHRQLSSSFDKFDLTPFPHINISAVPLDRFMTSFHHFCLTPGTYISLTFVWLLYTDRTSLGRTMSEVVLVFLSTYRKIENAVMQCKLRG